eukprot:253490-Hanusia_phi.AAC.1
MQGTGRYQSASSGPAPTCRQPRCRPGASASCQVAGEEEGADETLAIESCSTSFSFLSRNRACAPNAERERIRPVV